VCRAHLTAKKQENCYKTSDYSKFFVKKALAIAIVGTAVVAIEYCVRSRTIETAIKPQIAPNYLLKWL
jgi:hypothetical protein